jgi:hypothetical protein
VISHASAVLAARVAEVLLAILLEALLQILAAFAICIAALCLSRCYISAFIIVDVPPHFQIEVCFTRR